MLCAQTSWCMAVLARFPSAAARAAVSCAVSGLPCGTWLHRQLSAPGHWGAFAPRSAAAGGRSASCAMVGGPPVAA